MPLLPGDGAGEVLVGLLSRDAVPSALQDQVQATQGEADGDGLRLGANVLQLVGVDAGLVPAS